MGDWAALSELLDRLGPGDADERADVARQVYSQLEARRTAEPTSDQAAVHTNLKRWLARMASSRVQQDQLAATALLSVMVDADSLEDSEAVRMATQIKSLMQAPDMEVCVETMAVYRRLLLKRSRIVLSSVEADISRRLETLDGERSEVQRLVTLRLIEMVCGENLVPLYAYAPKLFASLTGLLCDRRLDTREAAGRALGACLGAVPLAERNPWLNVMFDDLQRSQLAGNVDSLHGSQLICQELLQNGGEYMQPHFAQTFETAMRLTTHRDGHVRRAAIEQLPMLAKYSPHEFSRIGASGESMLSRSCNYLVDLARSADSERATAFVALGQIAQHCSFEFGPFLEPAMRAIRDILAQQANAHSKNAADTSDGVTHGILQAIAMLAAAMGSALAEHMGDILDLMLAAGLSQPLCDALHALVRKVGQLQPAVLARVLDVVSVVLT
ncbi:phosphatidylinositol kinase- protein kinase tor1, partial [Coemansia spiralis]